MLSFYLIAALATAICFLQLLVKRLRRQSIDYLPGPAPYRWLVGNLPSLVRPREIGDADTAWKEEYGTTIKIQTQFGEPTLWTMDPKALQYILNTSGYNFPKPPDTRRATEHFIGRGIAWAEGTQHSRHRKIMNPAFSFTALRVFVPLFRSTAQRAVSKIKEELVGNNAPTVVNMYQWLSRMTLDAIGEAAFGYQFHAINMGLDSKLVRVFRDLFPETSLEPSDTSITLDAVMARCPDWLANLIFRIPTDRFKRLRIYLQTTRGVAKDIVDTQSELYATGKEGSKDVMAILVRANLSEDEKTKLSQDEILSQMTTLFLAGHDTTALTTSWLLYELSRKPEYQTRLREEIKEARSQAAQRGDTDLTIADLDSMKLMLATMKEILRFRPIIPGLIRQAGRDDVIPLAIPQKTKTGEMITSVPVSQGQRIFMSFYGYNRLKEVWGPDADEFRPERFFENSQREKVNVGVIGNVITFSSGIRGCIGWRFAVLEMQAILIELLESFEFSPPGNIEIIQGATGLMTPMIKGSGERKGQLPLVVTPI